MRRLALIVLCLGALLVVRLPFPTAPPTAEARALPRLPPPLDGCSDALAAHDLFKNALGADAAAAGRAQSLADIAAQTNEAPSVEQLEAMARTSARSIQQAGDALDKSATQVEQAMVRAGRRTPVDEFRRRLSHMRDQRTRWEKFAREEGRYISLSPQGQVRPTTAYEAAQSYVEAADDLSMIVQQTPTFISEGGWTIFAAKPDTAPPPNPGWNPTRGSRNLMRGGLNGLHTALALGRRQFPLATRYANAMQESVQEAASDAARIESALGPCRMNAADNAAKPKGVNNVLLPTAIVMASLSAACLAMCDDLMALSEAGLEEGGGGNPTLRDPGRWSCSSATRQCTARIVLNFPTAPSSGTIVVFSSPGGWAGSAPARKGEVPVELTKSYNTCYGTQTGLAIWNGTNANGPNTWTISTNIPVACG